MDGGTLDLKIHILRLLDQVNSKNFASGFQGAKMPGVANLRIALDPIGIDGSPLDGSPSLASLSS